MTATTRAATWGDRARILELIATMGGHEDILTHDDPMRSLGEALRDPNARAIVAERDARVVGVGLLTARASLTSDRRDAWLSGLAVDESERGTGVGARLLDAIDEAARTLGCETVTLQSSLRRTRAHEFYRNNAFDESEPAVRFARRVAAPPASASLATRFLAAAARAASAVNAAIVGLGDAAAVGIGADGAATEAADRAAETAAVAALRGLSLPIVSEEAGIIGDDPRAGEPWICLDPLDGSRNFRAGLGPYGIAIGLVCDGVALAGFVCDLSSGRRWWASDDGIAYADGRVVRAKRGELIGMPSPPGTHDLVRPSQIRHRVRVSGSCAIDLCRVAEGSLSAFVALARPVVHPHDLAGPSAILRAAGASLRDRDGMVPRIVTDPSHAYRLVAAADEELARSLIAEAA